MPCMWKPRWGVPAVRGHEMGAAADDAAAQRRANVTTLVKCSQHLAGHGGLQVLAMMRINGEAVLMNPNHVQGQSKISITNIQCNH